MLRGTKLADATTNLTTVSNCLVRGLVWPSDVRDLYDIVLTDEGEMFSANFDPNLYEKEGFMKFLRDHQEMLEFGLKYSMEDLIAYDMMVRNLDHVEGHYQLPLSWRNDAEKLPDSREMALQRLKGLKRRLQRDKSLKVKYFKEMKAVLDAGYAEPVPENFTATKNKVWYILHHPVVNSKKPEKARIVYDCAAVVGTKFLNDLLMKGPDLTNALTAVLLRFRKRLVPVIADVEAMFYQVRISPPDKDALRFYWWPNDYIDNDPIVYRMTVHLFGAKSSPSCATFCLCQTARQFGKHFDPVIAETVLKSFSVEDCLAGAESEEVAIDLVNNLPALLAMGRFKLTKWLYSSNIVIKSIPEEEKSNIVKSALASTALQQRVLGVSWNVMTDDFFFTTELANYLVTVTK